MAVWLTSGVRIQHQPGFGGDPRMSSSGRRHPFPRVFSACSRRQLRSFFRKGGGACLSNAPDPRLLLPSARCGNGFVEAGEECDCGSSQVKSSCPTSGDQGWAPLVPSPEVWSAAPSLFHSCLSDARSARTPAASPITVHCVRGPSALTGAVAPAAW